MHSPHEGYFKISLPITNRDILNKKTKKENNNLSRIRRTLLEKFTLANVPIHLLR